MRLADLMGARVRDRDGREIGHVSDVRLREHPGPAGTVLKVEGLVVATRARGRLIAYDHRPVDGPWPLAWLARWAARNARWAPWPAVAAHEPPARLGDPGTVRLAVPGGELAPLTDAHDAWNATEPPGRGAGS
ncbi:PRC-barrel domain-containing protein [Streptomyces sp. WAC08241]|uniref:PRC-barrel domain-containing protein n=1 Tax=Streptomyces sp. WAC08241 TaxID=2487421 RepID=UPI00163C4179|nr:PRC-barrel domain-containing protein [Streptomyces sp. WAC08241]